MRTQRGSAVLSVLLAWTVILAWSTVCLMLGWSARAVKDAQAMDIMSKEQVRALDIASRNLDLAARATDALGGCVEELHTPASERVQ